MAASQPHEEHKREIVENEHGNHAVHVEVDDYNETTKIEEQSAPTWSKEEEGQALRKLDWNLIPLLGALYLVSYIDRGSASKRGAGLAIFGMVGQCGPILGARLFPKTDQPWYAKGMWTCAGILFAAAALTNVLSLCLRFQNKKRDEKYGKSD
ncbi:hypothetical protein CBS470a_002157 [Colletotrichum nupharicola]|nr:hypothetical protein CBS470a_002157 [Colletotrichum nupharicola]